MNPIKIGNILSLKSRGSKFQQVNQQVIDVILFSAKKKYKEVANSTTNLPYDLKSQAGPLFKRV